MPSLRPSEPGFTFGWRSTSKVIYQVEPFTEPRHAEVLAELHRIPTPMMEVGGHQRWAIGRVPSQLGDRKPIHVRMYSLDSEAGLSPKFLARMRELGNKGFASIVTIIEQLAAVAADEVTGDTLSLMASQMVTDILRLKRIPCPEGWLLPNCVRYRFDRGSAVFLPNGALPFTGEETEREEQGDRIIRFRRRVAPKLSSLTAIRNETDACIDIALPGIPRTHPLAGWTKVEDAVQRTFEQSIHISNVA